MRKVIFLIIIITGMIAIGWGEENYNGIFGRNYKIAVSRVDQNRNLWADRIRELGGDPKILVPVIFPELARFSLLRDKMETTGLKIFYVNFGEAYSDFSIGMFQMKPSFVEKMEVYILSNSALSNFNFITLYNGDYNERDIREERITRLENMDWQIKYLVCFEAIIRYKFSAVEWENDIEKIRFYAASYNRGFDHLESEIIQSMDWAFFPYGTRYMGRQYSYHDVSVDFYKTYWKLFIEETNNAF